MSDRWGKYDWELVLKVPNGHKFYKDRISGRFAIADDSGRWPENTDDGVLWVDTDEPLKIGAIDKFKSDLRLYIPLVVERTGEESRTFEVVTAAPDVAKALGMTIKVPEWLFQLSRLPGLTLDQPKKSQEKAPLDVRSDEYYPEDDVR